MVRRVNLPFPHIKAFHGPLTHVVGIILVMKLSFDDPAESCGSGGILSPSQWLDSSIAKTRGDLELARKYS